MVIKSDRSRFWIAVGVTPIIWYASLLLHTIVFFEIELGSVPRAKPEVSASLMAWVFVPGFVFSSLLYALLCPPEARRNAYLWFRFYRGYLLVLVGAPILAFLLAVRARGYTYAIFLPAILVLYAPEVYLFAHRRFLDVTSKRARWVPREGFSKGFRVCACAVLGLFIFLILPYEIAWLLSDVLPRLRSHMEKLVLAFVMFFWIIASYLIPRAAYFVMTWRLATDGTPRCQNCYYILIGNVSGICPECGTPVAPDEAELIARAKTD